MRGGGGWGDSKPGSFNPLNGWMNNSDSTSFYAPVTIVRDIKICPCLSVRLSVRPFIALYGMGLCNQFLHQFSMDLFETLQTCYEHSEDVHVGFYGARNHFAKIAAF